MKQRLPGLARNRLAGPVRRCLFKRVNQKSPVLGQTDANEPQRTSRKVQFDVHSVTIRIGETIAPYGLGALK
jgi:hypothetical protein